MLAEGTRSLVSFPGAKLGGELDQQHHEEPPKGAKPGKLASGSELGRAENSSMF